MAATRRHVNTRSKYKNDEDNAARFLGSGYDQIGFKVIFINELIGKFFKLGVEIMHIYTFLAAFLFVLRKYSKYLLAS